MKATLIAAGIALAALGGCAGGEGEEAETEQEGGEREGEEEGGDD
jgi:hypothetical protein